MHGSCPREEHFAATALRASFANVQHSPSPTWEPILDSHHLATSPEYLVLSICLLREGNEGILTSDHKPRAHCFGAFEGVGNVFAVLLLSQRDC